MTMIDNKENSPETLSSIGKWIIRVLWFLAIGFVVVVFSIFIYLNSTDLPSFDQLENPEYDLASIIYDANGTPYGKYFVENRETVKYNELSPFIVDALIATEDVRFYAHSGVDIQALARVAFKTVLLSNESSGGGSTISQQLSKLLFDRPNLRGMGSIRRSLKLVGVKLKEWITAVKIERSYTKEEIMAMYLNKFEFINGAHGIQAASQTYFGVNQDKLSPGQAAVLVGMLKNPSLYNPKRFPEKSKYRRNIVLNQMRKSGKIDKAAYDTLKIQEIDMSGFERKTQSEGPAPYFRSELTKWLRNIFLKENILKSDGTPYNIYTDGLKIYTTIDLNYQRLAEEAVWEHMKWNQERYWRVWKGRNPWTYDADSDLRAIRQDILDRKVKSSDRYLALRENILGESLEKIRESFKELPLSDNNIKAMLLIEAEKSNYNKEVLARHIEKDNIDEYKSLIKKGSWDELKTNWDILLTKFEKEFSTPVKMLVFDYNESGEKEVEMSPLDSVKYHNQHLQAGMLAVDPHTGYIKAWVGGIDHKYFKYDHVNSRRSVGSTIKPFVYTTAIALQGMSPCQTFDDIQYTIPPGEPPFFLEKEWSPANANGEFTGNKYNLYQGLLYSKNSISVRLVKEMGNVNVIRELMDNLGIDKDLRLSDGRLAVPELPSICLGAVDLTLAEMTGAYTAFPNNGMYTEPIFITRIEDKNGKTIYSGIPERKVAINPLYNAVMVDMLKNNVGGTFGMGLKTPIGGKTGTTNDYADGWFMGITPNLVMGVWTGGDDKWIRFLTLDDGQGFVMARPIVEKFMKKIEKDSLINFDVSARFPSPPSGFYNIVDCDKFKQIKPEDERAELLKKKLKKDEFEEEFDNDF